MIWCRFEHAGKASYGIVENDVVHAVSGTPFDQYERTGKSHRLNEVKLLLPVIPGTFFTVTGNYKLHAELWAAKEGWPLKMPKEPGLNYRANSALIAHDEAIVKPKDLTGDFHYEAELVVVFGKKAKNVPKEKAMDYVLGYTIGNDISARDWQFGDDTWWRGKNADTFKPMGPWIVTGLDIKDMTTVVRINGRETDRFETGNIVFDIPTYIAHCTKYVTFSPGDVLWMGTEAMPSNMNVGDTIEIDITGIGTLRNHVVAGD